ncbi:MAG: hypothetical protein EOP04_28905 [Proteobacteria bacterium]|nr:MAG: hypothetical protein EOP04_28905 [Pseudomonadota bacterium]
MRPKLLGFLLLSLVAACHNDESSSSNPPPAIAPASPTQPRPTLVAAPVFDTVAPTVVNAYQVENESTVVVVFSEPMNSLVYFNRSMKSIIWSEDKTQLRATLQYKLDASSDNTEIQFNGLRDLNNNNLSTPFAFKFDQTNPHIEGVKILDNKNLQITFNETIVVQQDSKFIVNDLWQGTAVAEVRGQTLTLNFPEANFDSANSFSLKAMNFRDIYSNTESFQFIGLSKSDDTSPPLLKSYTLLARDKDIFGRRIAIHLEFDEYVVDTRDTKTGSLNSEGFDYSKDIRLNGKDASLTYWQPSADHKSANLLIHELSDEIKNREN